MPSSRKKLSPEEYQALVQKIAERLWRKMRRELVNQHDRRPRTTERR